MGVLTGLEPKEVFYYFEELCNIPHPSYKEKKISDYCVAFAKAHNLEVHQDELGNVIIIKEATPGYEEVEPLIVQAHLDMVCEKDADAAIDFDTDGLTLKVEGDYVTAEGTTLGADDGIGVAYALAMLASDTMKHPRIEAVFTVSEEVGMEGATAIDLSPLKGHKLLNLDSEDEGVFLTSCAGGCTSYLYLPLCYEKKQGMIYEITVGGLLGGHSGAEIDTGRANSNCLMGRFFLMLAEEMQYALISVAGGQKDNAIPRETKAQIMIGAGDEAVLEKVISKAEAILRKEYATTDPEICITFKKENGTEADVLTDACAQKVVTLINLLPNGVHTMSADIKGLVETSSNMGVLKTEENRLALTCSVRSSVQSAKEYIVSKLRTLILQLGGEIKVKSAYPAWEYRKDSVLRETMIRVYREMYGKEPEIQAIHAGLECGLLAGKIENLDAVAMGPDMADIHTTKERLSISSTKRVWDYLVTLLEQK